jgi:hypothetical protein
MQDWIYGKVFRMQRELNQHIEEFAAAFIQQTNLRPDQVVMKVKHTFTANGTEQTIWFEEKKEE